MTSQETSAQPIQGLMGRENEYANAAHMNLLQANVNQEEAWNLPHGFDVEVHGAAHHFIYLSAILGQSDPEMCELIEQERYQGNIDIEQMVVAVDYTLRPIVHSGKQVESVDEIKDQIRQRIQENHRMLDSLAIGGGKGGFYLGRAQNKTIGQVRYENEYDDRKIVQAATTHYMSTLGIELAQAATMSPGTINGLMWQNNIKDGDTYEVDGETQTYAEMKPIPVDEPAYDRMIDRISNAIFELQDELAAHAPDEKAALGRITLQDVYAAMLETPDFDHRARNAFFESQFGIQDEPHHVDDLVQG